MNSKIYFGLFIKDITLLRRIESEVRELKEGTKEKERGRGGEGIFLNTYIYF